MVRGRPKKDPKDRRKRRNVIEMHPEDFYGKTPETRAAQLANLPQFGGKKGMKTKGVTQKDLCEVDIITFATEILGVSFKERPGQEVILRALYGLPLSDEQVEIYRKLTTNETVFEPDMEKVEACWVVGARGGKSMLSSIIALYESICRAHIWKKHLQPGETGYCIITATRQVQSEQIIQANCSRLLENSKISYMIDNSWQAELSLKNGMHIASFPCNSTAARGLPIFLLIFDELAHYRTEGPKADETIHSSLRPRQAQFPGAKCLKISTPAAKQGLLFDEFDEGFQVPGRLTIQAPTRLVNPVIPQEFIDKEYKRDPDNAEREFGAQFAEQVSGFFASCIEALANCFTLPGGDIPYKAGNVYHCGIDQSGLAGRDRFALCISHKDVTLDKVIVAATRTWETKDSDIILGEIELLCTTYKIRQVYIDKYAGGWVKAALEKRGLEVIFRERLATLYINIKTLVVAGRLMLPDVKPLRSGLAMTQAFYGKSNTLSIAHERTAQGHGDLADGCVTSVFVAASKKVYHTRLTPEEIAASKERARQQQHYDRLRIGLVKKGA